MLRSVARLIYRRRWPVIGLWLVLTAFGAFSASQLSKRWFESLNRNRLLYSRWIGTVPSGQSPASGS